MENMLKEVLHELKNVNVRLGALEQGQKALEQGQKEILFDLAELKESQIELNSDLVESFGKFNNTIEEFVEDRTSALNKRVYTVESDIQKIMRQQQIN